MQGCLFDAGLPTSWTEDVLVDDPESCKWCCEGVNRSRTTVGFVQADSGSDMGESVLAPSVEDPDSHGSEVAARRKDANCNRSHSSRTGWPSHLVPLLLDLGPQTGFLVVRDPMARGTVWNRRLWRLPVKKTLFSMSRTVVDCLGRPHCFASAVDVSSLSGATPLQVPVSIDS